MEKGKQTYKLPEGWIEVEIKDISLKVNYGYTSKSTLINTGTKFLRITDIQDNHVDWNTVPYCEIDEFDKPKFLLNKGDIVFARTGATVGKSYLIGDKVSNAVFASYLIRIQLSILIDPKFVYYYFQSGNYWKQIGVKALGVGIPHVNATSLSKLKLPLTSINNQINIVSKIESLFSELDQAENGLQKAKQQLNVYRIAILKSAFEGKLTKLWRDENEPEDAEVLKTKIVTERLNRYKKEVVNWQKSYEIWKNKKIEKPFKPKELTFPSELEKNEVQDLEKLPKGATYTKVGFLTSIEMGQSPSGDSYNTKGDGIQLINGPVEFGPTPFSKTLAIKWTTKPTKKCEKGDLILCVRGSTTGKQNIANDIACIGRGVCSIRSEGVLQAYINHFFNYSNKKILEMGTGSTFPSISKEQILNIIIPLFSIEEQREIVAVIESQQTLIENLEKSIKISLSNCNVFRFSILKKAFEGRLVNQVSSEESASELLQKIRIEKLEYLKSQKSLEKLKPKKKRQMEKKKTVLEILKESNDPISTQELWTNSIHDGDIESFYSEIKEIHDKLNEVKESTESLLSLKK